jgi:hypothetical protein
MMLSTKPIGIVSFFLIVNSIFFTNVFIGNASNDRTNNRNLVEREFTLKKADIQLKNYAIKHQGKNVLDINIKYLDRASRSKSRNEKNLFLTRQLQELLENYPNEDDYWEIMNCNITKKLLQKNQDLSSITIAITVHPSRKFPYYRTTNVTRQGSDKIWESWHFAFDSDRVKKVDRRFEKISVDYIYKSNDLAYPNFVRVYKQIEKFLVANSTQESSWDSIDKKLKQIIKKENPKISDLSLKLMR